MSSIRSRLIIIFSLVAISVWQLFPRDVTISRKDPATGVKHDTTYRRVPLKRGLDLVGGMYVALEVDEANGVIANKSEAIDRAMTVVHNRIDEFGVAEPVVQKVGTDRIVVELPGIADRQRAEDLLRESAFLQFQITDKTRSLEKVMPRIDQIIRERGLAIGPAAAPAATDTAGKGALDLFTKPGDTAKGAAAKKGKGAAATPQPDTGFLATSGGPFSKLVQPGQVPGEYRIAIADVPVMKRYLDDPMVRNALPPGKAVHWGVLDETELAPTYAPIYVVDARPIITGEYLETAQLGNDPIEGNKVDFTLRIEGGRIFRAETARHIGDYMAIVLDDKVMGQPPVIQSAIGTRGQITMRGSPRQKVQDLALVLRAGALPVPLKVVESRTIGPSLGEDSIRAGEKAGFAGVVLVIIIMIGYYRFSGTLAVAALSLYVLWTLALLSGLDAVLTLPGLAGLVLSVGIAVDANVLIFERIREELDHGKSVRAAIDEGFKHAMSAIIDSNVSTALTALVLFEVGTGPVRGFAVTLLAGIAASMVSAIYVVRTFYLVWLSRRKNAQTVSILMLRILHNTSIDFIRLWKITTTVTLAFILPGIILVGVKGYNYSIDFTGGTAMMAFKTAPNPADIRTVIDGTGVRGAEITQFGADTAYLIRVQDPRQVEEQTRGAERVADRIDAALGKHYGAGAYVVVRTEAVGPKVGGELRQRALYAILVSFLVTLIYLAWRFEWRFGVAAVIATAHDILATLAFIKYTNLEVSLVVVGGILTMIGYSLNDTIIIFDRVRENLHKHKRQPLYDTLNRSVNETLPRSVLTHATTFATLLALTLLGGEVLRPFALVMLFGVVTGTFSSIYVASPILLWIEYKYPRAVGDSGGVGVKPMRAMDMRHAPDKTSSPIVH